jgi:hypothetical protein
MTGSSCIGAGVGSGSGIGAGGGGLVTGAGDSLIAENDMAIAISATVKPIEKAIPNLSAAVIGACDIWTVNKANYKMQ